MIDGITQLFEKLPNLALRASVPFLVVGGVLTVALHLGYVESDDLSGYPKQVAPSMIVLGVGLLISGLVFAIPRWAGRLKQGRSDRKKKAEDLQRLIENLGFLSDYARLVLMTIMEKPSGRYNVIGNDPFIDDLFQHGFLHPETRSGRVGRVPLGAAYVDRQLMTEKKTVFDALKPTLEQLLGTDVMDTKEAEAVWDRALAEFSSRSGLF